MVAMSGWIMPEPLAMPATVTSVSPMRARAHAPLANVSVVRIASAASRQPGAVSASHRPGSAAVILPTGRGSPITPVEATNTSSGSQPRSAAAVSASARTAASPAAPTSTLALPALTTRPRARPRGRMARHHATGWPGTRERVSRPATAVPWASSTSNRSGRPR